MPEVAHSVLEGGRRWLRTLEGLAVRPRALVGCLPLLVRDLTYRHPALLEVVVVVIPCLFVVRCSSGIVQIFLVWT